MGIILADIWAIDGLWILFIAVAGAGLVRGFSGFGTSMVYLPFAAMVLPPVWVIITVIAFDIFGPIPALPRAVRDGHTRDVFRLVLGAIIGLPIGVMLLTTLSPETFSLSVSVLTLGVLVALMTGFRYRGILHRWMIYVVGVVSGLLGGAVGLPGPPVVLIYMARDLPVAVIRASIMLFLYLTDLLMMAIFAANGIWDWTPVVIGLILMPVYLATLMVGSWIFNPEKQNLYRRVAYAIIAVSAITGLVASV